MEQTPASGLVSTSTAQGELFSLLLRLHPTSQGHAPSSSGAQVQAAFLDLIRQSDPALAERLHAPNHRRPYTLSLLQGFNHLPQAQLTEAMANNQHLPVLPGQVYWLRITMLDVTVFGSFIRHLLLKAHALTLRIGDTHFEVSRVIHAPDPQQNPSSWAAYSSFSELRTMQSVQKHYTFEFTSPTAFSKGQKSWGKQLLLFPTPFLVFENLARQWEIFAPAHLRLEGLTPQDIESWCDEYMVVSHYTLATRYLSSSKFGHVGFQGHVTYELKGNPTAPVAQWLTPLARFALFSGIGYKTAMGMGQARCTNLSIASPSEVAVTGGEA
jgi:CRISPR-associated endoribonuclease Cas6